MIPICHASTANCGDLISTKHGPLPLVFTYCDMCGRNMSNERADSWCEICAESVVDTYPEFDGYTMDGDTDVCDQCGGDGVVNLSDTPELWGEDCFSEEDRLVTCPSCRGEGCLPEVRP